MSRTLTVVLAVVGLIALALFGAPAATAFGANYVALGDSYSSGLGAGDESGDRRLGHPSPTPSGQTSPAWAAR